MVSISIHELAERICARIVNAQNYPHASQTILTGIGPLRTARRDWVSFFLNPKFIEEARTTEACAVITSQPIAGCSSIQLIHPNPYAAMAETSQFFHPPVHSYHGISPQAFVDPLATVHPSATLYPYAYVDKNAWVGPDVVIYPHVYVGADCRIGASSVLYPHVSILGKSAVGDRVLIHSGVVIGADGFGFAPSGVDIKKVPQLGCVIIEDDVEIGANSTIDRATFDQTLIKKGCKIDAQVHIGHNVVVGEWTMLCGQVGVAGSATIGSHCIAAGKAGISQGVTLGDRVVLGATAAALFDLKEAGEYQGIPAEPSMKWRREVASRKKMAELIKKVTILEKRLLELENKK